MRIAKERCYQQSSGARRTNVIVLTGNAHQNTPASFTLMGEPPAPADSTEFVTTSISLGAMGSSSGLTWPPSKPSARQLKFNNAHALVDLRCHPRAVVSEFRVLDRVTARESNLRTRIRFRFASVILELSPPNRS